MDKILRKYKWKLWKIINMYTFSEKKTRAKEKNSLYGTYIAHFCDYIYEKNTLLSELLTAPVKSGVSPSLKLLATFVFAQKYNWKLLPRKKWKLKQKFILVSKKHFFLFLIYLRGLYMGLCKGGSIQIWKWPTGIFLVSRWTSKCPSEIICVV